MKNRILIGVAGGTGSGKTTVANRIGQALNEEMVIIPQDYYYRDNPGVSLEERAKINYDHPDSFDTELLISHLKSLIAGETIQTPIYDFKEHRRIERTNEIKPAPIIILEGILIFINQDLRSLMDFKIFVDDPETRIKNWWRVVDLCAPLGEQFLELVESKKIRHIVERM